MKILCFGDSNTFGYIPGRGGRYDRHTRWPGRLQELLGSAYQVIEEGLCGRTTIFDDPLREGRCGIRMLPVVLETHNPIDIIVVMLGTNDCKSIYGATADFIGKGISKLIRQIRINGFFLNFGYFGL